MVGRKLNRPAGKIGTKFPVFWLREVGTEWYCRQCGQKKEKTDALLEILVREAGKNIKSEPTKLFLCMDCSIKLVQEVLDDVNTIKTFGPDTFKLLREM